MQASSYVGLFKALWAKKRDCHPAAGHPDEGGWAVLPY